MHHHPHCHVYGRSETYYVTIPMIAPIEINLVYNNGDVIVTKPAVEYREERRWKWVIDYCHCPEAWKKYQKRINTLETDLVTN